MQRLTQVRLSELDVTSGPIAEHEPGRFSVDEPLIRATVATVTARVACVQFRYLGPTSSRVMSGSGIEYHQIGLKLLSKNPCNLVYVMWRIQPSQELIVQVKRNPGQSTSEECGHRGYTTVARYPLAPFSAGEARELLAEVRGINGGGGEVRCWVDWHEMPRTTINPALLQGIEGPPGIRTDNGRYGLRYFIDSSQATSA